MVNKLAIVKPSSTPEKQTRTVVDTVMVTPNILETWKSPPFQRPVRENAKVHALAEEFKHSGGVWPGIVTLGILAKDTYIVDGQHRKSAFLLSGLAEGYTDIRMHYFETFADMGAEFVRLNSQLVRMRPDDMLRGLEASTPTLQYIRQTCPFVGYDFIRRSPAAPMVSMGGILRQWFMSAPDTPSSGTLGGRSSVEMANMTEQEYKPLCVFLNLAMSAWGRDPEYQRLWGGLNMVLCMWLYRRLVLTQYSAKSPRLTNEQFRKCLMSLSADAMYLDWLIGRNVSERDRAPGYSRVKAAFAQRLFIDTGHRMSLPQPVWAHGHGPKRND